MLKNTKGRFRDIKSRATLQTSDSAVVTWLDPFRDIKSRATLQTVKNQFRLKKGSVTSKAGLPFKRQYSDHS